MREIWRSSLDSYAHTKIGHKPVDEITTADVMNIVTPIWTDTTETAKRVRQRISTIMRGATAPTTPPAAQSPPRCHAKTPATIATPPCPTARWPQPSTLCERRKRHR